MVWKTQISWCIKLKIPGIAVPFHQQLLSLPDHVKNCVKNIKFENMLKWISWTTRKKKTKKRWTAWSKRYANDAFLVNEKVFYIQMFLTSDNHPTYKLIYFDKLELTFPAPLPSSLFMFEMCPRFEMEIVELLLSLNVDKWELNVHLFCSTFFL